MRALIIEIGKDYCIVLTRDGQFLRQRIPHGVFEIGDEIIVREEDNFKPAMVNIKMNRVRSSAVAASVILILAVGSIFAVRYLRDYYPGEVISEDMDAAATEKVIVAPEEDERAFNEEEAESMEESALAVALEEEAITFKNIYSLEEQGEIEEDIKEVICFSYKIVDEINLRIQLKNISSTSTFNGTFKLIMTSSDGSESRTEVISLEEFGPGKTKEYQMFIKAGEKNLKLEVAGNAY